MAAPLFSPSAYAQTVGSGAFSLQPTFTVQQTFTNNRDLTSANAHAESITQVSPGISISSRSGRVQGSLDYSLNALDYARASDRNTFQNSLNAGVRAEAVENHAYVDARASISQQTISAFGTQSAATGLVNDNRTEVSTLSISPSLRGNLAGAVDVAAQVTWSASSSASTTAGDTSNLNGSIGFSGRQGLFGWGLNASRQISDFSAGRRTADDQAGGSLTFSPDPELQLSLRGGWESSDLQTADSQSNKTWGWGVSWQPTDRTQIGLQTDHRFFGQSHGFTFQHRMARSIWTYADTRGISGDPRSQAANRPLSLYDLLFAQFASLEPDPIRRDQLVRSFLQANGLDGNAAVGGGFLNSAQTLQRSQNVSLAVTGVRTTITFAGFRTQTSRLDSVASVSDDLSQGAPVRQLGFSAGISHRLTETAALALAATQQKTLNAGAQPGNEQRSYTLSLSDSLGRRTTGILSVRHTKFDSETNPYTESAVVGSLSLRF